MNVVFLKIVTLACRGTILPSNFVQLLKLGSNAEIDSIVQQNAFTESSHASKITPSCSHHVAVVGSPWEMTVATTGLQKALSPSRARCKLVVFVLRLWA